MDLDKFISRKCWICQIFLVFKVELGSSGLGGGNLPTDLPMSNSEGGDLLPIAKVVGSGRQASKVSGSIYRVAWTPLTFVTTTPT